MGAKNKDSEPLPEVVSSDGNLGEPKKQTLKKPSKRVDVILGVVTLLIVVLALGFVLWPSSQNAKKQSGAPNGSVARDGTLVGTTKYSKDPIKVATGLALASKPDDAIKTLELAIADKHTTPLDKAEIRLQEASIAYNAGKFADAKRYALEADKLHATVSSAQLVANAAEKSADKATAVKYYQLVLDRMKGQPTIEGDEASAQADLARAEAL
ncbi:MAG: hypothetical protein JWN38_125 [Candidatus Saccharibacteria bacterium]|nr:hypothetical protein [Candidatus Saccharibacteria bacterium]